MASPSPPASRFVRHASSTAGVLAVLCSALLWLPGGRGNAARSQHGEANAPVAPGPARTIPAGASRAGFTPAVALAPALDAAAQLPRLRSLLVSRRGELVAERYFRGMRATRTANVKSASKSIVSALVGIAIDRGHISGVHAPIATYLPEYLRGDAFADKRAITIEDLLTMRSGLESTSSRNYGAWVRSANWVRYVLSRPLVSPPGTAMQYSTGSTHVLSAILTKATGKSTWQYAQETLGKPLGFSLARWPQDPQGIYFGGNEMLLTPRQMLAFGELYLRRGDVGGRQVVPAAWIEQSFVPRTQSRWSGRMYGYGWWMRELAGHLVHYAWGYGGQFIFVVPSLELVVVTTSSVEGGETRFEHLGDVYDLVERQVIVPVAELAP